MQEQTIQKIPKTKPKRVAPNFRRNPVRRNARQWKQPASGKGRKNIASFRSFGLPALNGVSQSINKISVAYEQGHSWKGRYDNYDFLADCELHTKLIGNLYPILARHSNFVDKTTWTETTEVKEVLTWIIDQFNDLLGNQNNWLITEPLDDGDCEVVAFYEHNVDCSVFYSLPLSFLPEMKKYNLILHDLLVDMFILLLSSSKIDTWYNEMGSWALDWMMDTYSCRLDDNDWEDGEKEYWDATIRTYYEGEAVEYENLFSTKTTNVSELEKRLSKFNPKNETEERFFDWLLQGIIVIKSDQNIYDLTLDPNDPDREDYSPLLPDRYVFLSWDFDDELFYSHQSYLESICNEYGTLPMTSWAITKATDKKFNLPKPTDYPIHLTEFFRTGVGLIEDFKKLTNQQHGN